MVFSCSLKYIFFNTNLAHYFIILYFISEDLVFAAAQIGNVHQILKYHQYALYINLIVKILKSLYFFCRICGKEKNKISPNLRHTLGWTLLMVASANGHADIVEELLKMGAQTDLQEEYHNPKKTADALGLNQLTGLLLISD